MVAPDRPDAAAATPPRTVERVLAAATDYFAKCRVDAPRATAEHLAARLLRCRRAGLTPFLERPVAEPFLEAMRRGMKRIASGEPLAYVLGQWDFRSLTLKTDARALIPRPETEELVDLVLESDAIRQATCPRVIDYGTGTGCIALALARECPAARIAALDVSADALALAAENAASLGLADRVSFLDLSAADLSDVFEPASVDVVVSNPPYIPSAVVDGLETKVRAFEPRLALDGGPDGADILRKVCEDASILLVAGGQLFLEIDAESGQASLLAPYLADLGFANIHMKKDLSGADRFLLATLSEGL